MKRVVDDVIRTSFTMALTAMHSPFELSGGFDFGGPMIAIEVLKRKAASHPGPHAFALAAPVLPGADRTFERLRCKLIKMREFSAVRNGFGSSWWHVKTRTTWMLCHAIPIVNRALKEYKRDACEGATSR